LGALKIFSILFISFSFGLISETRGATPFFLRCVQSLKPKPKLAWSLDGDRRFISLTSQDGATVFGKVIGSSEKNRQPLPIVFTNQEQILIPTPEEMTIKTSLVSKSFFESKTQNLINLLRDESPSRVGPTQYISYFSFQSESMVSARILEIDENSGIRPRIKVQLPTREEHLLSDEEFESVSISRESRNAFETITYPDLRDPEKFKAYFNINLTPKTPVLNQGCWGSCHLHASAVAIAEQIEGSPFDLQYLLGARQYSRVMRLLKEQYLNEGRILQPALDAIFDQGGSITDDLALLSHWTGVRMESSSIPNFILNSGEIVTITHRTIRNKFKNELQQTLLTSLAQKKNLNELLPEINQVFSKYFGPTFIDRTTSSQPYRGARVTTLSLGRKNKQTETEEFISHYKPAIKLTGKNRNLSDIRKQKIKVLEAFQVVNLDFLSSYLIKKTRTENRILILSINFPEKVNQAAQGAGSLHSLDREAYLFTENDERGRHAVYISGLKTELRAGTEVVTGLRVTNSYGTGSGVLGDFYIPFEALPYLGVKIQDVEIEY